MSKANKDFGLTKTGNYSYLQAPLKLKQIAGLSVVSGERGAMEPKMGKCNSHWRGSFLHTIRSDSGTACMDGLDE